MVTAFLILSALALLAIAVVLLVFAYDTLTAPAAPIYEDQLSCFQKPLATARRRPETTAEEGPREA